MPPKRTTPRMKHLAGELRKSRLPAKHTRLKSWYGRLARVELKSFAREKELHP